MSLKVPMQCARKQVCSAVCVAHKHARKPSGLNDIAIQWHPPQPHGPHWRSRSRKSRLLPLPVPLTLPLPSPLPPPLSCSHLTLQNFHWLVR